MGTKDDAAAPAAKTPGGEAAPLPALTIAIVAPRKTVKYEGQYAGPGKEVSLPAAEVAELRALGFLVDPNADPAPAVGEGPTFETEGDGTSVRPAE